MKAKVVTTATEQSKSSGAKPQEASQGRRLVTKAAAAAAAAAAVATDEAPASRGAQQFLIKSEPHEYSIDDLASKPGGIGQWDGIRNFRARNLLKTIQVYHTPTTCLRAVSCSWCPPYLAPVAEGRIGGRVRLGPPLLLLLL